MFHLDNNSGVSAMPPVGAVQSSAPRWYTEGGGGTPASYPGSDWYNIVQAELLNLLSAYGITPNKSDFNQLQKAIEEAIKQKATASSALLTAIAALVTSADKMPYFTGKDKVAMTDLTGFARTLLGRSDAAGVLSDLGLGELVLAGTMTGSFDTNGYLILPVIIGATKKDLIVQWGQGNNTASATSQISYPIPFPNKVFQVVAMGFQVAGNQQSYVTLNSITPLDRFTWNGFFAAGGSAPVLSTQAGQVSCRYIAIGW